MTGYYSCIQFCPNRSRAEALNVGVLLKPDKSFVLVRTSPDNNRIAAVFDIPPERLPNIEAGKIAFAKRLLGFLSVAALHEFSMTRANDFQLTPPRPMRFLKLTPDDEIDRLYLELVAWPPKS